MTKAERQKVKARKQMCEIRRYWKDLNIQRKKLGKKAINISQAMFRWCESGEAAKFDDEFKKGEK